MAYIVTDAVRRCHVARRRCAAYLRGRSCSFDFRGDQDRRLRSMVMTFRDDREALFARVEALERACAELEGEREALEQKLAQGPSAEDGMALQRVNAKNRRLEKQLVRALGQCEEERRALVELRRENRRLVDELHRARRPSWWERIVARVAAWRAGDGSARPKASPRQAPTTCRDRRLYDGWLATDGSAVRRVYPLHACSLPLLVLPAGLRRAWYASVAFAFILGARYLPR
jgi:hypothetical protein